MEKARCNFGIFLHLWQGLQVNCSICDRANSKRSTRVSSLHMNFTSWNHTKQTCVLSTSMCRVSSDACQRPHCMIRHLDTSHQLPHVPIICSFPPGWNIETVSWVQQVISPVEQKLWELQTIWPQLWHFIGCWEWSFQVTNLNLLPHIWAQRLHSW